MKKIVPVVTQKQQFDYQDESISMTIFWKTFDYQDFDARVNNIGFSADFSTTGEKPWISILMEEIKSVVA